MARAARSTRRRQSTREPAETDRSPRERVIDGLMRLAGEQDFGSIGLGDVAAAADVPLATLREMYDGKLGILADFSRQIDTVVLAKGPAEGDEPRDRLFDMMMRRFDALAPYKTGIRGVAASARRDPFLARVLYRTALRSQMWMLVGAGIHKRGLAGRIAIHGAVMVYAEALRVFLDDDDPGLSRTMASLDRGLARGEQAMQWLDRLCGLVPDLRGRSSRRRPEGRESEPA